MGQRCTQECKNLCPFPAVMLHRRLPKVQLPQVGTAHLLLLNPMLQCFGMAVGQYLVPVTDPAPVRGTQQWLLRRRVHAVASIAPTGQSANNSLAAALNGENSKKHFAHAEWCNQSCGASGCWCLVYCVTHNAGT